MYSLHSARHIRVHIDQLHRILVPGLGSQYFRCMTIRDIACVPLKYILSAIHVRHTDIWVLDVEGAEEKALLGTGEDISVGN